MKSPFAILRELERRLRENCDKAQRVEELARLNALKQQFERAEAALAPGKK